MNDSTKRTELPSTALISASESRDSFGRLFTVPTTPETSSLDLLDSILPPHDTEMAYPTGIVDLAIREDSAGGLIDTSHNEEPSLDIDSGHASKRVKQFDTPSPKEREATPGSEAYDELREMAVKSTLEELLKQSVRAEVEGDLNASAIIDGEFSKRIHEIRQATGDLTSLEDLFLKRKQLADELWNERIKTEELPPLDNKEDVDKLGIPARPATIPPSLENAAKSEIPAQEPDSLLAIAKKWHESKGNSELIENSEQAMDAYLKQIYLDLETGTDPLKDATSTEEVQQIVSLVNAYLKSRLKKEDGTSIDPDIAANLSYALHRSALEKFRPSDVPRNVIADGPTKQTKVEMQSEPSVEADTRQPDKEVSIGTLASQWERSGRATEFLKKDTDKITEQLMLLWGSIDEGNNPLDGVKDADVQPILDFLGNYLSKVFSFYNEQGLPVRLSTNQINTFIGEIKRRASKS